ncbi:MAG: sugar ABC transporter permease [Peptostreptococcaceae bacterium]|jgi:raffinose/stachyose/melibiose transport system permease protein|nr:sugar ABC transporter permease [Peptostreptococcaceae bacterium]MBQ1793864.1 sugar ABC transporter permease [Peptostreptococcaceae bacterium]
MDSKVKIQKEKTDISTNGDKSSRKVKKISSSKHGLSYWGFVGPSLFAFSLVIIIPLILGIYYSFTDWNGISSTINWVGFENYIEAFSDTGFKQSFIFTAKFTVVAVLVINAIGFSLALLVTRESRISNLLRTIFFMPNLIGGLILGFIWQFIFVNVFNGLGDVLGQTWLMGWLSNETTGFWGMVIIVAWQMAGYVMVIYVAGLQNVPPELNEAAKIDGANVLQRVRLITFPMIRPAFTVSLFLTLSNSFKLFDQNLALTNGGPGNATQMLALNIYQTAFSYNKMSLAQAKAVIFFVLVAIITLVQVYVTKKGEVEM